MGGAADFRNKKNMWLKSTTTTTTLDYDNSNDGLMDIIFLS